MSSLSQTISAHPFFTGMKPEHLEIVLEGAVEATFAPDQYLFHEGDPANQFFLIQNGRIALEAHEPADGTVTVQTLGAGEVLGWSWLFQPFSWHFRARAIEPTTVIILNGGHLLATAERDHEFGFKLMKRVAQIVIQRLMATRRELLKEQFESFEKG